MPLHPLTDAPPPGTDGPPPLGPRVRALRAQQGWTLEQASRATGLARSTLSKIENGQMSPTYENLIRLAAGLGVDVADLFAAGAAHMGTGRRSITRAGEGQQHETPVYAHALLAAELSHKRMLPFRTRVRARSVDEFDDWMRHPGEEMFYVLSGRVALHTECYAPVELGEGDCAYIDSRMGHLCLSVGDDDALVLWISCPGPFAEANTLP